MVSADVQRKREGRRRVGRIEKHASHASTPRHIALGGSQIVAEQQNRQTIVSCSNLTLLMRAGLNEVATVAALMVQGNGAPTD